MTSRMPWSQDSDPRPLWKLWDKFDMEGTEMIGYWSDECPIHTDRPYVAATVYKKGGKAMIALASWAEDEVEVKLDINWNELGLEREKVKSFIPYIRDFQEEDNNWTVDKKISVSPGEGVILILKQN